MIFLSFYNVFNLITFSQVLTGGEKIWLYKKMQSLRFINNTTTLKIAGRWFSPDVFIEIVRPPAFTRTGNQEPVVVKAHLEAP